MNTIDTRDLIEERDSNKQAILDDFNDTFNTELEEYEMIEVYLEDEVAEYITAEEKEEFYSLWKDEIDKITEVDELEREMSSEFVYGVQMIPNEDFTEYCKELLEDCGDLPRNLPFYIKDNIDWDGVAHDLSADYSYVDFRGTNFLYRD